MAKNNEYESLKRIRYIILFNLYKVKKMNSAFCSKQYKFCIFVKLRPRLFLRLLLCAVTVIQRLG